MNLQIISLWQSILLHGKTVLPYVGLVLLIIFAILVLIVFVYLLYRLARRLPIFLRYSGWRAVTAFRRLRDWLRRGRASSAHPVFAAFHASNKPAVPLEMSFSGGQRRRPWTSTQISRPQDPLFLVLGFEGSGKSTLLAMGGQVDSDVTNTRSSTCELVWWRMEHGWALEVNQSLVSAYDTQRFSSMIKVLEQLCPACPLDGLIVVLTAGQLLSDGEGSHAVKTLACASSNIARQLGAALPIKLVISHTDSLRGFDALLKLRSMSGQSQATLGMNLPIATPTQARYPIAEMLRESVQGQVLLALSMQTTSSENFDLRQALELPSEIDGFRASLHQFESQLSADSSATASPWLSGVVLTGFAPSTGSASQGELVFAGQDLREQLFVKSVSLPPRAAFQLQRQQQATRAAALTFIGFAGCLALILWSGLTWKRLDQNIATLERLLDDIKPELHVAKNSYIGLTGSLGMHSQEKLLNTVIELDKTAIAFALIPNSWRSEVRTDALKGVGEVINRTLIRDRSQQLATDIPRASQALLPPSSGVSAQRIEELPAYHDLLAFLDSRELVGLSINSAQRINKEVSYEEFVRFLGSKPEQLKLPLIEWNAAMPISVTQRFKVDTLKSPEIESALRQTIDSYWERLVQEALDQHPVALVSGDVQEGMLSVSNSVFGIQEARQLESNLKRLKRETELPSSRRFFGSKTEAMSFFAKAQLRLGVSSVVSSGQAIDLAVLLEKRFESMRTAMLQKEAEGVGMLFISDAREGTLQLSPEIKRFSSAYTSYMSQPFMRAAGNSQPMTAGKGQYLEWNLNEIEPARILAEALRDFSTGGALAFDNRLKGGLMRLARNNYIRQIDLLFSNAAHLREETQVRTQSGADVSSNAGGHGLRKLPLRVANLAAAGKLYRLLQPTDGAASSMSAVSDQLVREGRRTLEQLEEELYREDPYAPLISEIANWLRVQSSEKMLTSGLKGNTKERLVSSREYVRQQYAAAALPLLEFLTAEATRVAPGDVVLRWSRLREAIDGYEKGNASNGIYELERYVLALTKLRGANECVGFLEERQLPVQRGDYFSQQLVNLDEAVTNNCEQRLKQSQRNNYENFAGWFNTSIAGRPPFNSSGWHSGPAPLAVPLFERMLSRYSEYRQSLQGDIKNRDNLPADVSLFIERMDQLAAYFLSPQKQGKPGIANSGSTAKLSSRSEDVRSDMPFRAKLEFRSGRSYEAGADQIIDWSISSGGRRYRSRGSELFQWKIGEPIEVQFRWAANSPVSPLAAASNTNNYSVGERSASFKYNGDWALFELLDKHKTSAIETDGGVALFFRIPTMGPSGRQDAKTFISLVPPEKGNILLPVFPAQAPMFPKNWSN